MKQLTLLTLLFLGLFLPQQAHATHIIGANITYESIGPCTYRIYLTRYFDCGGAAFSPNIPVSTSVPPNPGGVSIGLGSGTGCAQPTPLSNWILSSFTEITLLCPGSNLITNCENNSSINGVAEATYYQDYSFCNTTCNEFLLEYSSCCRNSTISSGAADDAITVFATIPGPPASILNSTPDFPEDPVVYICKESPTAVPMGGTDPDGDSLVYELVNCYQNSQQPVGYLPGYSALTPLGTSWTVNLNSQTGWLTLVPDSTTQIEIGVICIETKEYRNGNLIGSTTRDFQINVTTCGTSNQAPDIQAIQLLNGGQVISADTIGACPGSPLSFSIAATDVDPGDVLSFSSGITASLPGAQSTVSGTNPAILTISWTPDSSDLGQVFPLLVSVSDSTCPYPLHDFEAYYVSVGAPCLAADITDAACNDSTGVIQLQVYGGIAPYTYLWSTGDTTKDIQNLTVGSYWVNVSDSGGQLFLTDTFFVSGSNIQVQASQTTPDCDGNGGELHLQASGGIAPYTYEWSNGDTTNPLVGIQPGGYSVIVRDSTGCPRQQTFFLTPNSSCFVSVSGTAYYDLDGDCVQDSNELGIPYMFIEISPGSATFTDANGHYTAHVDTGSYTFEAQPISSLFLTPLCPVNGEHSLSFSSFSMDTSGVDFAMDVVPVQDLRVSGSFMGWNNPGFPYVYSLHAYNDGTLPATATLDFDLAPLMSYDSTTLTPVIYDSAAHQLSWQLGTLSPGQTVWIKIYGSISSTAMIGDSLTTIATIHPIVGDTMPANNIFADVSSTVGSFDPNDKQVFPAGFGEQGFIEAHENEMLYTIRFQNTGNFPAQFVVIRDTIHANLDLSSYQAMAQSHAYTLDVEEDSILVFTFADIDLPDSASNPAGSQGFVRFKLLHEGSLSLGDQIRNSAAIYFDFNDPIITNEVLNTIYSPMTLDFLHDDPFCPDDSLVGMLVQTGLAPFSYQWSSGLQDSNLTEIIYPTDVLSSGVYSLTVKDALGISVTDSVSITVESLPLAHAGVDIQGLAISFTDSSSFAENWLWDFGDGNTSSEGSPSHVYATGGDYQIRLIVSNGCGSDTSFFDISLTTSVEDLFAASVEVMPNPFSEQTTIRFSNPGQEAIRLTVLDMKGKLVYKQENIRSEEVLLGRQALSTGIYFLHLSSDLKQFYGKLMVK